METAPKFTMKNELSVFAERELIISRLVGVTDVQ
jgi:hypothetical protein